MNYNSSIRSNYFKITDRDAFKKLCDKLSGEDSVEVSLNEQNMACISCYGMLTWDDNEDDDDIDIDLNKFYELLQPIIDPNDASYLEDSYCIEEDTSLVELDTELYNKGKINIVPEMVDIETEE